MLIEIQGDVALNLYDFNVRRPGKLTEKYGLRAYDEIILAPMVGRAIYFLSLKSLTSPSSVLVRATGYRIR